MNQSGFLRKQEKSCPEMFVLKNIHLCCLFFLSWKPGKLPYDVRRMSSHNKICSSPRICFGNNTACEDSRMTRLRANSCHFRNGKCECVFSFFSGGCNHGLILESSWSTCSWLSCESLVVDETQSHPSFSTHTHHKPTNKQTRGFPIAWSRARCYSRLICLAARFHRLEHVDRSQLICRVLLGPTEDTVSYTPPVM